MNRNLPRRTVPNRTRVLWAETQGRVAPVCNQPPYCQRKGLRRDVPATFPTPVLCGSDWTLPQAPHCSSFPTTARGLGWRFEVYTYTQTTFILKHIASKNVNNDDSNNKKNILTSHNKRSEFSLLILHRSILYSGIPCVTFNVAHISTGHRNTTSPQIQAKTSTCVQKSKLHTIKFYSNKLKTNN
jgi:hypothetical protein